MAHADSTVTISRPIGEVFAYLADGTNNPHWRAGVLEIERISPAGGDQAAYRQVLKGPGGRRIDGDYRITEYHPPRVIGFEVTAGPLRPAGRFTLAEAGQDATTVSFSLDAQPAGFMRLMSGMIIRQMRAEVAQLDRLKQILER
jgi:uncharacterized membrane protein